MLLVRARHLCVDRPRMRAGTHAVAVCMQRRCKAGTADRQHNVQQSMGKARVPRTPRLLFPLASQQM